MYYGLTGEPNPLSINRDHGKNPLAVIPDASVNLILADCTTEEELENVWPEYERVLVDTGAVSLNASNKRAPKLAKIRMTSLVSTTDYAEGHQSLLFAPNGRNITRNSDASLLVDEDEGEPPAASDEASHRPEDDDVDEWDDDRETPKAQINRKPRKDGTARKSDPAPVEMPIDLLTVLILRHTDPGDTVLDCCRRPNNARAICAENNRNYIRVVLPQVVPPLDMSDDAEDGDMEYADTSSSIPRDHAEWNRIIRKDDMRAPASNERFYL